MSEARRAWVKRAADRWKNLSEAERLKVSKGARLAYERAYESEFPDEYKAEKERKARKSRSGEPPCITAQEAANLVAKYTGVSVCELFGAGRDANLVRARALYVAVRMDFSCSDKPMKPIVLALELGRDRTTIVHLLRRILPRLESEEGEPANFYQSCGLSTGAAKQEGME